MIAIILAATAFAVGGFYGFYAGYENGYLKCREDVAKERRKNEEVR